MNSSSNRTHQRLLALLIAVFSGSCTTTEQPAETPAVRQRPDLLGQSFASVSERLGGKTISDDTSPASELGGEFYTPINARYPLRDPASHRVLIREVRWQHGERFIAVFFNRQDGAWVSFHALDWRKGIVF